MNVEAAERVQVHKPLPPEERARADLYALLARFFQGAPDAKLLGALSMAGELPTESDRDFARAWSDLVAASSAMDAEAATEEYAALFESVGSAEVSIYSGFYTGAMSVDHPRVRIRNDLADLGLAPVARVTEPEDHFAGLFEAMRILVAGGAGRTGAPVGEQRAFFAAHVEPGAPKFFHAVQEAGSANFYKKVAGLGIAFMALESESFRLG